MAADSKYYFLWSIILGLGYEFFMTSGFTITPERKPYNKLFEVNTYVTHLSAASILVVSGFYLCMRTLPATGLFVPVVFLSTFFFVDKTALLLTGRHIIIAFGKDDKPAAYKWYVDGLLGFLVVFTPLISVGIALNWLRFGKLLT